MTIVMIPGFKVFFNVSSLKLLGESNLTFDNKVESEFVEDYKNFS